MSYSSFESDKKLMENWRRFSKAKKVNEEQVQLIVVEEEQVDEALIAGATLAVLAKVGTYIMYFAIGQREKINKIIDNLAANNKVPPPVKKFFNKMAECLDAAAEAAPALEKAAKMGNSNWNPLSWKQNALMAGLEAWTSPGEDSPEGEIAQGTDDVPPGME